jgi:hypothetical protein
MVDGEAFADVLEIAELRGRPKAAGDGVEHGEPDRRGERIGVEGAGAGLVASAVPAAGAGEEGSDPAEDLQAREITERSGDFIGDVHAHHA